MMQKLLKLLHASVCIIPSLFSDGLIGRLHESQAFADFVIHRV
jgi:hypothetical protein